MYITDGLVNFLHSSMLLSSSTIILTDLNKVVFVASSDDTNYLNKHLHDNLKQLLYLYISNPSYADYMNSSMDAIIPIVEDDDISKYKSQIVLPIVHNNVVDRFAYFCY